MGIRVAYGPRNNIKAAIANGIVPVDSIIITSDEQNTAELMFYDDKTTLKHIVSKTKFDSVDDAMRYAAENSCSGNIVTVLESGKYQAFIVQPDNTLSPVGSGSILPESESLLSRIEKLEDNSHSHDNKELLDSLTPEMIETWNNALTPGNDTLSLVKGSSAENGVSIAEDGTMVINEVSITKIVQSPEEELIFSCGDANI